MNDIVAGGFFSFTLAILLLFAGKGALARVSVLRNYSIPEPVIGGFLCAATVAALYFAFGIKVTFDVQARDLLLLYFFAAMGLNADIKSLLNGGKPLLILVGLAAFYIVLQNSIGMSVAGAFGMDPKAGLMSGSVSLIGGVGTTLAWAPTFVEKLGITNAMELGIASNTIGLIFACVIGGPIAKYLMKKHSLSGNTEESLDIGQSYSKPSEMVDSYSLLFAWLRLNLALMLGYGIDLGLESLGVELPLFVSCLMAGIIFGNRFYKVLPKQSVEGSDRGLSIISDICLGMFIVMALMDLKVWELSGLMGYLSVVMGLQIIVSVLFATFIVYRLMGKGYESAVICSGFGGITLGSTATAIANMSAVTKQHGAAHQAFIVVPLVCGFFVDILNAIAINFFISL
ncbi:sodium/glutamate symporter [Vibrio sp. UCD-FRSSP16_10]|uniref:sodium/glutamate symporter n=1 Tax=unclassified Vibrio TaxID=2614977 RepID=UPI0007FCD0A6|nr:MULTISPECIES: sodium/glutamate symporter [unclassified Vibrio]OBT12062.1 sodium/glutamate symporter [Vibrio sp. UCD-FRSSP16_30]OBT20393.1 sodium/glutamate symporter [Vibrio sp. UCD-FRSSP16_10]